MRVLREGVTQPVLDHGLVVDDDLLPVGGAQVGVDGDAQPVLVVVQHLLEIVMAQAEHDAGIHSDEAAIAVEGEAAVAGQGSKPLDRLIVQAEVQDRVHHPRHGGAGSRTDRDQQRIPRIAEGLADDSLDRLQPGGDLAGQRIGIGLAVRIIVDAGFRRDGEARRHRQAERRHLGEVGPLAAEQVLHRRIAVGRAPAEAVHPLSHRLVPEVSSSGA